MIEETNFSTKEKLPEINFLNQKVIVTVSQYNVKSAKVNIGNVKYKMSPIQDKYIVNLLVVSKIVNRVGVNINSASESLLSHVSGLDKKSIKISANRSY